MISYDTFRMVCFIWIGAGILLFPLLLRISQPYGKHMRKGWGPVIDNRLGWLIMELPALLVFFLFLGLSPGFDNKIVLIAALLWGLHYFHRSLIFPFRIKTKGKKMPVLIVLLAIVFNTVNGFLNGYWLSAFAPSANTNNSLHLYVGVLLFLAGFIINQYHDRLLIKLRNGGSPEYKIPYGGLFRYISCPNYFGEMLAWLGFFVVTQGLPAFSFFVWTMVNLIPRALDNHKWYLKNFPEYPARRKAVIPFIL